MELNIHLHWKQGQAFQSKATEILYGGAAGGGKSYLMRAAAVVWCAQIPGLQVYLFRRISLDLYKNHLEGPKGFRALLSDMVEGGLVAIVEDEIRFWNGSKIYLCHCKDEKDRFKYQGAEIHVLMIDELTHFTEVIYRFLRSRVRLTGLTLPKEYQHKFPLILCASNPGNIGHQFVKAMFIDSAPPMEIYRTSPEEGGMLRQYIPARLDDNPSMTTDDPMYESRLSGLGSPALVKAYRDGDWNVVAGAYFSEFGGKHIVTPFEIPAHWIRFRSFDWGSYRPHCVHWWAVSDGAILPRGALVAYREWYGCTDQPNTGLKLTAEQVADGIIERELKGERFAMSRADPSIFKEDGGPSIAERMHKRGVNFTPADNSRKGGWDQVRARLIGEEGLPRIYFFNTCLHTIRTFPALQHDEADPEDLDSDGEDHAADSIRYACLSRPYIRDLKQAPVIKGIEAATFAEVTQAHKRRMAALRNAI